jgi:SagB-type dehydrogenase family enzyme
MMNLKSVFFFLNFLTIGLIAQPAKVIKLNPPDLSIGSNTMKSFSERASVREFDTTMLKIQDLSNLLWVANGINRKDTGKRTAPSAQNAQDIDVYVCLREGIYLYDAKNHLLNLVTEGDYRILTEGRKEGADLAPFICLLVSDISRFKFGTDSTKTILGAIDAGIVSQNICIFCAAVGLSTRPRAGMNQEKLREVLKLKDSQLLLMNNPVSYRKN